MECQQQALPTLAEADTTASTASTSASTTPPQPPPGHAAQLLRLQHGHEAPAPSDRKAREERAKAVLGALGIQHLSYTCPGLHGRMDVHPTSFGQLFGEDRIVIPLFQRHYCWAAAQAVKWWEAVRGGGHSCYRVAGNKHHCGKIIVIRAREDKRTLLIVDGQQRATTTMLLVASLRDAALELASTAGFPGECMALVRTLNRILYRDLKAAKAFAEAAAARYARGELATWSEAIGEGVALPFVRLTPSHADRAPFFELVLAGICNSALRRIRQAGQDGLERSPPPPCSPATRTSCQYGTKSTFDAKARSLLADAGANPTTTTPTTTTTTAPPAAPGWQRGVAALRETAEGALQRMHYIQMEILEEVRLGQVFLWLQEKGLFSAAGLLFNPHPGLKFHACDMVRNLLLSPFMDSATLARQSELLAELWIDPLERRIPDPEEMDAMLAAHMKAQGFAFSTPGRFQGEFEHKVLALEKRHGSPIVLYAHFHSFYEQHLLASLAAFFAGEAGGTPAGGASDDSGMDCEETATAAAGSTSDEEHLHAALLALLRGLASFALGYSAAAEE